MTSRERPAPALDADRRDEPPEATAAASAAAAEAEAAAAEAEARAATARARALRLRRQAGEAGSGSDAADSDTADRPGRRRPHATKVVTVAAALVLLCGSLAASGYMVWHHRIAAQERQRNAEFTAAAREAAVTFMSLDFNKLDEGIQRIADISTGQFKDRFPIIGDQMAKRVQQSKLVTTATVNEVAVESMTADSAIVLVAATTESKSPEGAQEPQFWHMALRLTEDGGQPKISNVEFVQ